MISPLRPGLAMKATMICRWRTTTTSEHRMRNTSIRTRKIRGDDSFSGSRSGAMVRVNTPFYVDSHYGTATASESPTLERNFVRQTVTADFPGKAQAIEPGGTPVRPSCGPRVALGGLIAPVRRFCRPARMMGLAGLSEIGVG